MSTRGIAVIVPTTGRESLQNALYSIDGAGRDMSDRVLVSCDCPTTSLGPGWWRATMRGVSCWIGSTGEPSHNDYGGWARNQALDYLALRAAEGRPATGWVAYLDDDDEMEDGALDVIRSTLARRDPTRPELHIFRTRFNDPRVKAGPDGCLWADQELRIGNISTCMLVHSLAPLADLDVRWRSDVYEHDYHFAADLVAAGFATYWHDGVIASVRPNGHLARITTCAHAG